MKIYKQLKPFKKTNSLHHWTFGLNRRDFIKGGIAASLLASIVSCKPSLEDVEVDEKHGNTKNVDPINHATDIVQLAEYTFSQKQQKDLQAIYMRLFPNDGNGPSANDINVVTYLEWAMTDMTNKADGDPEFIAKGIGWLNQLSNDEHGKDFKETSDKQQDAMIAQTINSKQGNNWVSILTYYLIEAITLDPYYGGNTMQLGWKWLEHQGGFPQPIAGKTYKDFES